MFKRRFIWLGELVSDEGFRLAHGNRSIKYKDERGSFEFPWEGGVLYLKPFQIAGPPLALSPANLEVILDRVVRGLQFEGHEVKIYRPG